MQKTCLPLLLVPADEVLVRCELLRLLLGSSVFVPRQILKAPLHNPPESAVVQLLHGTELSTMQVGCNYKVTYDPRMEELVRGLLFGYACLERLLCKILLGPELDVLSTSSSSSMAWADDAMYQFSNIYCTTSSTLIENCRLYYSQVTVDPQKSIDCVQRN